MAFHNTLVFLKRQVVSPLPSPKAGETPSVCCLQLHILYIYGYLSHLDVICPICNLRMCHAMVTGDQMVWPELAQARYDRCECGNKAASHKWREFIDQQNKYQLLKGQILLHSQDCILNHICFMVFIRIQFWTPTFQCQTSWKCHVRLHWVRPIPADSLLKSPHHP